MRDRPVYIGLMCWCLIIFYTWAIMHAFASYHSKAVQKKMHLVPLPVEVQVTQYFAAIAVPLVTAIFMYEGYNWARVLYIAWGIANYLLEAIFVPNKHDLMPGLPIFAFCAILLLLPAPRGYFLLPRHFS